MRSLLALALLTACAACTAYTWDPPLPPRPPPEQSDAGACERACARLSELGCEEAQPTPGGATCLEVCETAETSGYFTLDPNCIAEVGQCSDVERCTYGD